MGVVNDAVQDRITEGGIGNDVVPLRYGDLACDQERSFVVAVIDDLEEIAPLLGGERLWSPIVDDEEIGTLQRGHETHQAAFAAGLGEIGEQARRALVEDGEAVAAGLVAERAGEP